jgi:hypothetical protein
VVAAKVGTMREEPVKDAEGNLPIGEGLAIDVGLGNEGPFAVVTVAGTAERPFAAEGHFVASHGDPSVVAAVAGLADLVEESTKSAVAAACRKEASATRQARDLLLRHGTLALIASLEERSTVLDSRRQTRPP